jgi:D-alanyl-D-alanine carboxypeptidase/D-alanyl-D-alanine-endopeptidase (penicillin-binding protein 4)
MPKFGAYNLDGNIIKIIVKPTTAMSPADIYTEVFYPIGFVNLVTTGQENKIKVSHNETISHNLLELQGAVKQLTQIKIPVNNIKLYFKLRLEEAINEAKVFYYGKIYQKNLPTTNVYLVDKVERSISLAMKDILQKSNNMTAETVFKLGGAKFSNGTGTVEAAIEMFNDFCKKNNLSTDNIKIVDGSGVSKNNLTTADFMTQFLVAESKNNNFNEFKSAMAYPGIGTLNNRMLYFKENLRAKTGTLSDVSAIAGYIVTRKGKEYAFDIMINEPKSQANDKKMLEEMIIRAIYTDY